MTGIVNILQTFEMTAHWGSWGVHMQLDVERARRLSARIV